MRRRALNADPLSESTTAGLPCRSIALTRHAQAQIPSSASSTTLASTIREWSSWARMITALVPSARRRSSPSICHIPFGRLARNRLKLDRGRLAGVGLVRP